jgi:hypothetical protein
VGLNAGLDGCGKSGPPTGVRYPDRPARSKSLYKIDRVTVIIYIYFREICNKVYVLSDRVKASNMVDALFKVYVFGTLS